MDRVLRHLDYVPIEFVLLAAIGSVVTAILFPKKYGVEAALIFAFAWLNLNRFKNLGAIDSLTKATFWLPLVALIYFAQVRPGPKQKVPALTWFYLVVPVLGCLCIVMARDALLGMVQFCTMFLTAAAALSLYRVVDSEQTLKRYLFCMFAGLLVPIAVSLIALIFFRARSYIPGIGRFAPFGMASNQFVSILATVVSLAACGVVASKSKVYKLICLGTAGISVTLLLATGSRQGVVLMAICLLPALIWFVRRPLAIIPAAVVLIGMAFWTFKYTADDTATGRLTDFSNTSGRYETAMEYLDVIGRRPLTGLLGTRGHSVLHAQTAGHIPHNAYLGMLYVGGAMLAAPLLAALIVTLISMKQVLFQSGRVDVQPMLLWLLAALLLSIYAHALVNDMAYWSVSSWTFLHYFLSCFFIGLAHQVRAAAYVPWRQYQPA